MADKTSNSPLTGMEPGLSGSFHDHELENERQRRRTNLIFRPDAIPSGYYTSDEWLDRGYAPREGEFPGAAIFYYGGRPPGMLSSGLYHFTQMREIRGAKAARRRRLFHATLAAQGKSIR